MKIKDRIRSWGEALSHRMQQTLRTYPVELALATWATVLAALFYEEVLGDDRVPMLVALPLGTTLVYTLNCLTRNGGKRIWYYLSWLPLLPLSALPALKGWAQTSQGVVTLAILCPLAVLMCRQAAENRPFVRDAVGYLKTAIVAGVLAGIACWLVVAIYKSFVFIFGIDVPWETDRSIWFYTALICNLWIGAWLFFGRLDRSLGDDAPASGFSETVLNFLLGPAILIYTAMLYLYGAKILVEWSLPKGGVAYLVFGFTILAVAVRALHERTVRRPLAWYFDRLSWFALPVLALFWAGVVRRTTEYGLTDWRVYLIACGALMTATLFSLWSRRWGRYLYVCATAFLLFAAMAYIPRFSAERIALRSQTRRAERLARAVGLLDDGGLLVRRPRTTADSVDLHTYRELGEALGYLADNDAAALHRLGVDSMEVYYDLFPPSLYHRVRWGWDDADTAVAAETGGIRISDDGRALTEGIGGYGRIYLFERCRRTDNCSRYADDTLRLRLCDGRTFRISGHELAERQLAAAFPGGGEITAGDLKDRARELLTFRSDSMLIRFSSLDLDPGRRELCGAEVEFMLLR